MNATQTSTNLLPGAEARFQPNNPGAPAASLSSIAAAGTPPRWQVGDPPAPTGRTRSAKARLMLGLLPTVGLVLALTAGYRWVAHARRWVKTDNAYVAAHIHTISARVAGTVKEVLVEENEWVAAGTLLARLDERDLAVRRRQAEAQLAQARAQVRQAEAKQGEAEAQLARDQARTTKARQDLARAEALYQGTAGAISRQEFDQAKTDCQAAEAGLQAAASAVQSAGALIAAAHAQEEVAQANLQDAELQLS